MCMSQQGHNSEVTGECQNKQPFTSPLLSLRWGHAGEEQYQTFKAWKSQGESRLLIVCSRKGVFDRRQISPESTVLRSAARVKTRVDAEWHCHHYTSQSPEMSTFAGCQWFYTIFRSDVGVQLKVISVSFPFAAIAFDEEAVDAAWVDSTKMTTLRSLFFTERCANFACWCRDPKVHTVFTFKMALTLFILFLLPS